MSPEDLCPAESDYVRLAVERLARPYLKDRSVAYLEGGNPPKPSPEILDAADTVIILHESGEYANMYENIGHQRVMFPHLPYPDGYFEAVVAFGALEASEEPQALVREARRVLGEGGALVLCTPDKQAYANERNLRSSEHRRTLYEPELREILEAHFEEVHLYRVGAVAGGLVLELAEGAKSVTVDAADIPLGDYILAVCGPDSELEAPLLALDEEGLVFEELEEAGREAELLRAEIRQMQRTEVQSFQDALKLERERVSKLGSEAESKEQRINELQNRLEARESAAKKCLEENEKLKAKNGVLRERLQRIEGSRTWRALSLYRRLRGVLRGSGEGR